MVYANRPIERFWFLETVARMPYFVYISMVGAGTCIAVLNGMNGSLWGGYVCKPLLLPPPVCGLNMP